MSLMKLGLVLLGGILVYDSLRSKRIFVSYKYTGDSKYKNLLVAWSKNHKFSVSFDDVSSDISIDSWDHEVIKSGIAPQIYKADIFLCIIGKNTHKSSFVEWEILKAIEMKKKIVAVKTNKNNISPEVIKNIGAVWALRFKEKEIIKALKEAAKKA